MENFEIGLVSIIIPVFNRENLLPETIDSILGQTYTKWECIIIDDGSSDSSLFVAKEYANLDHRFKVYSRPWYKTKGANTCRNYGFELSKGEFIQWFDSDDIMNPYMIEKKISMLLSCSSDLVINRLGFFKNNINDFSIDTRLTIQSNSNNLPFDFFAGNFWFQTSQPFFKKSFLKVQNKLFDINLNRNQETELFVRLLIKNPKISYINDVLILQRMHKNSIGGIYSKYSESSKYLIDLPAYKLLFISFLNTSFLTDEVLLYFKKYFNSCLKKMNFNLIQMLNLLFFCFKYKLFYSNTLAFKIFLSRFLVFLKNV
jgi:glycosyltransferase involved in cell wall biosynthesis